MDSPIRLLIAGGSPLLHLGLVAAVQQEPRLRIVGQSLTKAEGLARLLPEPSDVLVLHTDAPRADAAKAMEWATTQASPLRVLLLTNSDSREDLLGALRAGVHGYGIVGELLPEDLCAGVLTLARSGEWLCPLTTRLVRTLALDQRVGAPHNGLSGPVLLNPVPKLSEQEEKVLELFAAGVREQEIAHRLSLARNTVKTYLSRIRVKFGVSTRSEAVRLAVQLKVIPDRRASGANGAAWPRRALPGAGLGVAAGGLDDRRAPR